MERQTRRKRCVIFPGALGDFICFLPALAVLSDSAEVDVFSRSEFRDIAPERVRVYSIERDEIARLFAPGADSDERVTGYFRQYSDVYSWHGSRSPVFVAALKGWFGERARIFPFYPDERGAHQSDYFLSCVGERELKRFPVVRPDAGAVAWAADYLRRQGFRNEPLLGIAPGSGAREKNWPAANFAHVSRWWREDVGGSVLLFLGPAEESRSDIHALRKSAIVAENLPLARLAASLAAVDVYLGNDSGVTHLAAAVGTRTVALFGPSS